MQNYKNWLIAPFHTWHVTCNTIVRDTRRLFMKGTILSKGIGIGYPFIYKKESIEIPTHAPESIEKELKSFENAVKESMQDIERLKENAKSQNQEATYEVLSAHGHMLNDPELKSEVIRLIKDESKNVYQAVEITKSKFMEMLLAIDDPYFQERAHDINEICTKLIRKMIGLKEVTLDHFEKDVIIIADELLPGETAGLDIKHVKGLIMRVGGQTSHSAIIANNLGIPAMVLPSILDSDFIDHKKLILDCISNSLLLTPSSSQLEEATVKIESIRQHQKTLEKYKDASAKTLDGKSIGVLANISSASDLEMVIENGAEGIGLFRTEFLYMGRNNLPSEDEQFEIYKSVLEAMGDKVVIIRTFDIGGDKNLSYYPIPEEENPFMGYRAIRISLEDKDLFRTQLRALLRASFYGNCKIMFPMIASIDEVREAKAFTNEVMAELRVENIKFDENIALGIMVEIPSVAACAHHYATETDFFSIGTNDLTQYTLAADRMNEKVSKVYNSYNPGVVQLIAHTIQSASSNNIEVGMCGELAGEAKMIPLLLALGIDELSMSAGKILEAKSIVSQCDLKALESLPDQIKKLKTSSDIENYLQKRLDGIMGKGGGR